MSMRQIVSVVALVLIVGLAAWGLTLVHARPQSAVTAPDIQHPLPGTLSQDGTSYTYTYTDGKYYSVTATYPAHTSLAGDADATARVALEAGLASQVNDFKSMLEQSITPEEKARMDQDGGQYAFDAEYQEFTSPHFDSYLYTIYEDTGGAHPNGYFATFVFDQHGNQLDLRDLFTVASSTYLARIAPLAEAQVKAQITERLGANSQGMLFEDGFAPTDDNYSNFVVDGGDLHFFFPPYQVAAYAAGNFDVSIPLSSLSDILAPGVL